METRHVTPLTPEQMAKAKEGEKERQKWDRGYVTAEQVDAMSPAQLEDPTTQQRISSSIHDWPERHMAMSEAAPPSALKGGAGEIVTDRSVTGEALFASVGDGRMAATAAPAPEGAE